MATVSIIALSNARAKSRDAKRAGNVKQVQTALELFFNDKGRYPTNEEWASGQLFSTTSGATTTYMQIIPSAPTPADGACDSSSNVFSYNQTENGSSYNLSFCLGGRTGILLSGDKCATPGGIINEVCDPCGGLSSVVYGTSTYPLVGINKQCWFAKNLDFGTVISNVANQGDADGGDFERYCYNNDSANCDIYGGLYQWHTAMALTQTCDSTDCSAQIEEVHQGICPLGWHVPDESEWQVLENYLKDEAETCDPDRSWAGDCSPAGTALKSGGSSNWNGLLTGWANHMGGWEYNGSRGIFLSVSPLPSANGSWARALSSADGLLWRWGIYRWSGISLRCIKN